MIVISLIPKSILKGFSKQQVLREIRKAQGFGAEQPARYQLLGEKMDPERMMKSRRIMFSQCFPKCSANFPGSGCFF